MPRTPAPATGEAMPRLLEEQINDLRRLTFVTHVLWEQISPGSKCSPIEEAIEANIIAAAEMARSLCSDFNAGVRA